MLDVNAYAEELVNVFSFDFPLPPIYSNARPDLGIYSHNNSSSETVTPARYAPSALPMLLLCQLVKHVVCALISLSTMLRRNLAMEDLGSLSTHNSQRNQHRVCKPQ
jgi:hypothetical protein